MVLIKKIVVTLIGILSTYSITSASEEILVSTSQGVYLLGEPVPFLSQKIDKNTNITSFKSVWTDNNELLVAWGAGRRLLDTDNKIASITISSYPDKKIKVL